ncbi:winged helix-turn-helix transcriptional regulator [Alkaliphilus serpentinus]|uniref:Winged helix-turn-helix transcriptional regulator n=1 Tax=Alkaliphilus serpentinus TaxID=1482731 RepID=A0A833M764_9FIRM|nr:winged helix-turn-helix transcriptional regulator [Alkaliphilus serpentinus]KAB3529713.1 winged helix-turn-helix transcriptional regulator [Alkaliphilus serpentinus]
MDKEYILLELINENKLLSQRQLSEKTGFSLGSINVLIKKMVKEGFIKIENIPANRVVYMITPKGMVEKVNKTYKYIKHHYTYINNTKEKIKKLFIRVLSEYNKVFIILGQDEISSLIKSSIEELDIDEKFIHFGEDEKHDIRGVFIVTNHEDYEKYKTLGYETINILEEL